MNDIAIRVNNLSKCYQIYDTPRDRLKQFVVPTLCHVFPPLRKFFCASYLSISNLKCMSIKLLFLLFWNENMRLTRQQTETITQTVSCLAGAGAAVYLFGSRLNDQAKGGDVDLFIESDMPLSLIHRAQIKMKLESQLALPVDIVAKLRSAVATPFQNIAKFHAVQLGV